MVTPYIGDEKKKKKKKKANKSWLDVLTMAPGLLYVTMQPGESLSQAKFHDWYNNEHGPTRLRLPFVENGFRYRATDLSGSGGASKDMPEWMAVYDITDMHEMKREPYLRLRRDDVKSAREKATMSQIAIDRQLYDFFESDQADGHVPLDDLSRKDEDTAGSVLLVVSVTLHAGKEEEFNKWHREEHVPMLSKVPGWLRTRRFVTSSVEPKDVTEYLSLHEYAPQNGLDGPEFKAAVSSPWRGRIMADAVKDRSSRVYELYYTFGAAPRDLSSPASDAEQPFTSPDGLTKVLPSSSPGSQDTTSIPAIESFVTTPDGVDLPYRLEGSTDPNAPLIVLSNSILTHYSIWDGFLGELFGDAARRNNNNNNNKYRVLRYLPRGRFSKCGEQPVTVDLLASDIIALLDALRVKKAAALIGVSLGGATVLNAALKYPDRVGRFVACDTNAKSPEGNHKAWNERAATAKDEGAVRSASTSSSSYSSPFALPGEPIVGDKLADATVRRWFVPESYSHPSTEALASQVTDMVRTNSLAGFEKSVQALFSYDLRDEMKRSDKKGAFVVGSGDGVLPKTMREMAGMMGREAEFFVVEGAGHLPMVEKPKEFATAVAGFLAAKE